MTVFVPSLPAPIALSIPDPTTVQDGLSVRLNPVVQDDDSVNPVASGIETVTTRSSAAEPAPSLRLETKLSTMKSFENDSPVVTVKPLLTLKVGASVSNADACQSAAFSLILHCKRRTRGCGFSYKQKHTTSAFHSVPTRNVSPVAINSNGVDRGMFACNSRPATVEQRSRRPLSNTLTITTSRFQAEDMFVLGVIASVLLVCD